jgi:hypothetical protein
MELSQNPKAVYMRKWCAENRERAREIQKRTYLKNREIRKKAMREYHIRHAIELKEKVFGHYGPSGRIACSWPGCDWSDTRALSIDHVDGNGAEHRRTLGSSRTGLQFYAWLVREGFPAGYQTLCMNHQWVKAMDNREIGKVSDGR